MHGDLLRAAVLFLLLATPGTQSEAAGQAFPRLQEGRGVAVVVPDTFRVPAHIGETPSDLEGVSGIVVSWNPSVDLIILAKDGGATDISAVIGAFLRTSRTTVGSRGVLLIAGPPPSTGHAAGPLRDFMARLRSAPTAHVEGLGPSRVLRFDSPQALMRYAAFARRGR